MRSITILFLTSFLLRGLSAMSQTEEALLSDIKSCVEFYWQGTQISKQISKSHDTSTYFHDGEIIVYFNKKESRSLSANTFYIFNHGFNKLIDLQIGSIEVEVSNTRKDKKTFITVPNSYFEVFYQDSLPKCGRMVAGPLTVNVSGYKKTEVKAILVKIEYYNQTIYKWFLKEPELAQSQLEIKWQKERM